jgi:hypothetical protein
MRDGIRCPPEGVRLRLWAEDNDGSMALEDLWI